MTRVTLCDICKEIIPKKDGFFEEDNSGHIRIGRGTNFELCDSCTAPFRTLLEEKGLDTRSFLEQAQDACDEG